MDSNTPTPLRTMSGDRIDDAIASLFDILEQHGFSFDEGMGVLAYSAARIIHQFQQACPKALGKEAEIIDSLGRSVAANLEMIRSGYINLN